jgi:chromosome segregation ATPase
MRAAATTLTEHQAEFEIELSRTAAARDDFKRQVHVAETALAEARHDHATAATEVGRLAQREAELTSQLAEAAATRRSLEGQLVDAERQHLSAMTTAATTLAEREAQFEVELSQRAAARY